MNHEPTQLRTPPVQIGAVHALAELLTLHPELPPVSWHISEDDGVLRGSTHGVNTRAVIAAYANVLGGQTWPPSRYEFDGHVRVSEWLHATWHDVNVFLTAHSDVDAYPELSGAKQVAA